MTRDDIIRMAREVGIPTGRFGGYDKELERFAALIASAERERIEAAGTSLYERTGDIKDANTLLIQRNAIREGDSNA